MRATPLIAALALAAAAVAQDVPKPRILVVATAAAGMDESRDEEAQALIEEALQDLGFETIDSTQLASIKDVDDALNKGDKEKILALRTRYGAEVIVAVKYDKQFATGGAPGSQMWWYLFNGKAVRTDTAAQITSKSTKSPRPRNSFNHFVDTAKLFAQEIGDKIVQAWQKEATQGLKIQLMVSRGDASTFSMLSDSLSKLPTVASCAQRRMQRDTAEYEVLYKGTKDQFIVDLQNLQSPAVKVTGYEANRVDAEITSAPPPPPADTTPPYVTISQPAEGALLNSTRVQVNGTVDDPSVRTVSVNGVQANVSNGGYSASISLTEGANTITAIATDPAGNQGRATRSVTVDTQPPGVSIVAPQNGRNLSQLETSVGVKVTGDDVVRVEVNGVPAELFRAPDTWKATIKLQEGQNIEIRAVAYDRANNQGSDRVLVNVDTTPPEIQGNVTVIVSGKVDDPSHKVTVNGTPVRVNADGSWQTTVDISKSKIVTIEAEDEFGNKTVKVLDYSK